MTLIKRIFFLLVKSYLTLVSFPTAQDISSDFWSSNYLQISHDYGTGWQTNSSFKPYQWDNINESILNDSSQFSTQWMLDDWNSLSIRNIIKLGEETDKLQCKAWLGTLLLSSDGNGTKFQGGSTTLYGYFHFSYRNHLRAWLYPRITTDRYSLPHFTGKPRPTRRAGFNTGETDMAGIGYFGDRFQAWFGRGRQNWGAMALDNIALSEKSAAYDHGTLQLNFSKVRLRYFYGYLETLENNSQRYITGRGIEYNNQRNLVIGAHEIVIYSGVDRPFDLAYLNPIATHLEVELNQRDNHPGGFGGQNAVWQLSTDWIPLKGLRVSNNLLFDEFSLDNVEKDSLGRTSYAIQSHIAYSRTVFSFLATIDFNYTKIGINTFRHEQGGNNFVSRNLPLGSDLGSDGDRWQIGARLVSPWRWITNISFGKQRNGEQNILQNIYEPKSQLVNVPFPSGVVNETIYFCWEAGWYPRANIRINIQSQIAESNLDGNVNYFLLSIDAYLPKHFEL